MIHEELTRCTTLGLQASFGFGDRIGLATPGHVAAMQQAGGSIAPIFPQQSIREMKRTKRTARQVMDDACRGARVAGWTGPCGADADHLKTAEDVDVTVEAGFTFFTIDPSDHVDQQADDYGEAELRARAATTNVAVKWSREYQGQSVTLPTGTILEFNEVACLRAAVKYGRAVVAALDLAQYIDQANQRLGRDYEIELSIDETDQPTTLVEHYIIADQCRQGEMRLVSLAPRFIGELEKGVDYKGDLSLLEDSLKDHAAIANLLGPYKLSLHSGSDKLSMYGALARATDGRFHVKTAGTSYLEALRVVARHESDLFRDIITFARSRYDVDKATYHVSATNETVLPPSTSDTEGDLERRYLECWDDVAQGEGFTAPGRQILHCTFGSTLTHPEFGQAIRQTLEAHPSTYRDVLADHFSRHLQALSGG